MLNTRGSIRISRIRGNVPEEGLVRIEVEEKNSGSIALTLEITLRQLGELLTGSQAEGPIEFNDSGIIGKVHQHKTEFVPGVVKGYRKDEGYRDECNKLVEPFEIDGWMARGGDINNQHTWVRLKDGTEGHNVVFFRYVDKETGEPWIKK